MSTDDTNIRQISYLLNMIGRKKRTESFESLVHPNISANMEIMLAAPPIAEDDYICETTVDQREVLSTIREIYESLIQKSNPDEVFDSEINTDLHLKYVERYLNEPLPGPYYMLDASQLWMIYWLTNSLVVLSGDDLLDELSKQVSEKVNALVVDNGRGGIAGGPNMHMGHMASTYALILLLVIAEDYETIEKIKENLYEWLLSLKNEDGSFAMHEGGESDTRSTYCALVISSILNMDTERLWAGTREWLSSCQTYEGGFAGVPDTEAHGGYTFCAVAAFYILGREEGDFDEGLLLHWLADRQLSLEGGFSGRSNKLVDACYSFWVGGVYALMESSTQEQVFNKEALISYITNCCQDVNHGGLKDKPGKSPDLYHTNYSLLGLSMGEFCFNNVKGDAYSFLVTEKTKGSSYTLPVSPVFGVPLRSIEKAHKHFYGK